MSGRPLLFRLIVLAIALLFVPSTADVFAQDRAVERIKQIYEDIGKKIVLSENGTEDSSIAGIFCSELAVNKNKHIWPVVGNYETTYKFYYELSHAEGHPYPDRLRKVVMKSSMSDRSYYSEYLFDEDGELVFYYAKPTEPQIGDEPQREEQRIYLAGRRPIRMIIGQKVKSAFTVNEKALALGVVKTSTDIKLFFAKSLALPIE